MMQSSNQVLEFNKRCHNAIAHKYVKRHSDIFNSIEQQRLASSLKQACQNINKNALLLDLGCGSGNLTNHLLGLGFNVTSADISEEFLNMVMESHKGNPLHSVQLLTGDLDCDFTGKKFDGIFVYSVLHHLPDYIGAIRTMANLLNPGGILYIDHEASPSFWENKDAYRQLQRKSIVKKAASKIKNIFDWRWYLCRWKMMYNPRFQPEGDIHVWPDDHIEWNLIDTALKDSGMVNKYACDYLVYQNHYEFKRFQAYGRLVSDMRMVVYTKL